MARARVIELRLAATVAVSLLASSGVARAEGITAQLEGDNSTASTTTRDETGRESRGDSVLWTQKYRLALDQELMPLVRFNAGGFLDWSNGSSTLDGVRTDLDDKKWDGNAHLRFGGPALSGGVDYDRREETTETRTAGVTLTAPGLVREAYGASGSWRPIDLPSLDLRLSRANSFDTARLTLDQTTDEAIVSSRFDPAPSVDLRYSVRYGSFDDRLGGARTTDVLNAFSATWTDKFLDGRGNAYVSYNVGARNSDTAVTGAGGTVATQRLPVAGLSLVEGPADTPDHVTLNPNAKLVDGITSSTDPANPASAGVNLGFSASAGPLVTFRDLGAQLANVVTEVNAVYVWVDKQLTPALAATFSWTAWQSDDNVTWTPVPLAGAVVFDTLLFRFQIPIQRTQARYLKVVTKPLQRALTTDPQFADVFVTELQLFDVVPAELVRGRSFTLSGNLNGTARVMLVPAASLAYDVSTTITHSNLPSLVTYAVVNGLSASKRLARTLGLSGRADRSDSDSGKGHESLNRLGSTLSFDPLPALGGTLTYTAQVAQTRLGTALGQAATLLGRADLYEGLAASATAGVSWARSEADRATRGTSASGSVSVTPNRVLSLSGSGSYTYSLQTGGGQADATDRRGLLQASASLSPFPALSLAGSVVRVFTNVGASNLVNFSGGLSLFPAGSLQLAYQYTETLDTGAESRTRLHGPSLRWNIRPGWLFNAAYSFQDQTAPAQELFGRAFTASLLITFR